MEIHTYGHTKSAMTDITHKCRLHALPNDCAYEHAISQPAEPSEYNQISSKQTGQMPLFVITTKHKKCSIRDCCCCCVFTMKSVSGSKIPIKSKEQHQENKHKMPQKIVLGTFFVSIETQILLTCDNQNNPRH